jgi:copper chaperone CopZ
MDFNATVDLIVRELYEAREIIDDLRNYPGVPSIQVELAKSKCKSAADIIALLKNMQNGTAVRSKVVTESKPESVIEPEFKSEPVKVEQVKSTPVEKPAAVKKEVKQESPVIHIIEASHGSKKKSAAKTIFADTFSDRPGNLNEQMTSLREDEGFSEIIKTKPITSLSDAIGVNDKFLFIRELFNGNPESYERAITSLDNAKDLSDARKIIIDYTGEISGNDASKQLFELIKRKFPVNE